MNATESQGRFYDTFGHRHVVLPVIHVASHDQANRNAEIARKAGADGVFLMNHDISSKVLLEVRQGVCDLFPDWFVGINCLDLSADQVFKHLTPGVAGVWVDNAMIHEDRDEQADAEAILQLQRQTGWQGLYFGGVAFKYQRPVEDVAAAAMRARPYMDVVTTSGPGAGVPADADKIRTMKEAIGSHPLAVASGVTPGNVKDYLPYSDCYVVATGISWTFEELDEHLTRKLVDLVREYDA